jgi:hypothetical protein
MKGSSGLLFPTCPSTRLSPSPPPTRSTSSMRVETNTSMSSHGRSRPRASSGTPPTLSSPSAGTTVLPFSHRTNHHLERGHKSTQGGRQAACGSHHAHQVQPHWQSHGDQRPHRNYRCLEGNQPAGSLSERVGHHALCFFGDRSIRLQGQFGKPLSVRWTFGDSLFGQRHEHVF